jgi:hypothetical protein
MEKEEIQMTVEKQRRLLEEVYKQVSPDEVKHLSEDELAAYVMELMDEDERAPVADHLAACELCEAEVEELKAATEAWRGQDGEQRLAMLRDKTRAKALAAVKFAEAQPITLFDGSGSFDVPVTLLYPVHQVERRAFKTSLKPTMYQTIDELAVFSLCEQDNGDLLVYIDSSVVKSEGREIVISIQSKKLTGEPVQWIKTLSRIDSEQVGAKLVITREERQRLPDDSGLSIGPKDGGEVNRVVE